MQAARTRLAQVEVRGGTSSRSALWVALLAVAGLALPQLAGATVFSWGTVSASDSINTIHVANASTATYDGTDLVISGDVSSITFNNKATISGIIGVSFTTTLQIVPGPIFAGTNFMVANFSSSTGFELRDTNLALGFQLLLFGDYDGTLEMTGASSSFATGEVSADLDNVTGQQADFVAAFSQEGSFDTNLSFGEGTVCDLVVNCTGNPFTTTLKNFNASAVTTLKHTPEPNTLTLTMLGLVGLAVAARPRTSKA